MGVGDLKSAVGTPAYTAGGVTLAVALAAILGALAIEHIGGYAPCPLCLEQRTAYYVGIPLLFLALVLVSADRGRLAALLFFTVALAFLLNAGLGVYHAGAEWKFWPGPETCAAAGGVTKSAGNLLGELAKTRVVRCDEPALLVFGLSLAAWNAITSLLLFITSLKAAFFSAPQRRK
jgi:disulfide bond formation protein DsbB